MKAQRSSPRRKGYTGEVVLGFPVLPPARPVTLCTRLVTAGPLCVFSCLSQLPCSTCQGIFLASYCPASWPLDQDRKRAHRRNRKSVWEPVALHILCQILNSPKWPVCVADLSPGPLPRPASDWSPSPRHTLLCSPKWPHAGSEGQEGQQERGSRETLRLIALPGRW